MTTAEFAAVTEITYAAGNLADLVTHLRSLTSKDPFVRAAAVQVELDVRSTEDVVALAGLLGLSTRMDRRDTVARILAHLC